MTKFLFLVAAVCCTFFFSPKTYADEGEVYAGGALAYQFDNSFFGLEGRAGYYFTEKLAGQLQATYYLIGTDEGQTVYSFSPSIRYDIAMMKKIGFYGRLGYTYLTDDKDVTGENADLTRSYNLINFVPGLVIPISGIDFFGELDLAYQLESDNTQGGLRTAFRFGAQFGL